MFSLPLVAWLVLQGTLALRWQTGVQAVRWQTSNNDNTTLHRCVGHDVTFHWSYVTETGEHVMAVFWFSDQNGTIATLFANHFLTSSDRVTYVPNAGITLSGVTTSDVGLYGVHVRLLAADHLESRVTRLVVVEPPTTRNGQLQIDQLSHNASSTGFDSMQPKVQLRCGEIIREGFPPVSAEWTDPDGQQLTTTDFQDGFFLLDLPPNHKGGNYNCSLVLDPEVSKCLEGDSPLTTSATLFVETMATRVEDQGRELEAVMGEVAELRRRAGDLLSDGTAAMLQDVQERVDSLQDLADNLTQQMDSDRATALRHFHDNRDHITATHNTSEDLVEGLERRTRQELKEQASKVMEQVAAVSGKLKVQENTTADHDKKIEYLQQQVVTLQSSLGDTQKLSGELQKKVDSLQTELAQQKTNNSELHNKVATLQGQVDRQEEASAQHTQDLQALKASLDTTLNALTSQQALSSNLSHSLSRLEGQLAAQHKVSQGQERVNTEVKASLAELQDGLTQQQTAIQGLQRGLDDGLDEQEKAMSAARQRVDDLQQTLDKLDNDTAGQLTAVDDRLTWLQQNLTYYTSLHDIRQQTLRDVLRNSSASVKEELRLLDLRVNQLNQSVTSAVTTVSAVGLSQVTDLQSNLTALGSQLTSLLPRVQTVEGELVAVNDKLFPIRLVGGRTEREGRVEIRVGDRWGTVCDDGWDNNEAKVVCNMLGFFQPGAVARSEATFGQGTGPIVLDDLQCTGTEQDIRVCPARAFGTHNCAHTEDAGVVCAG